MHINADKLSEHAKALADPRRIELLRFLSDGHEHCVCEIAEALGMAEFQVSRQLAPLKRLGLVVARREGTWMHYHACNEACTALKHAFLDILSPAPFSQIHSSVCSSNPKGSLCPKPVF